MTSLKTNENFIILCVTACYLPRGEKRNEHEVEHLLSPGADFKYVCNCTFIKRPNFGGYNGREKCPSPPKHFFYLRESLADDLNRDK